MPQKSITAEKKLPLKQRKWLKVYLETGNATEAARQAYDCTEESTHVIASENFANHRATSNGPYLRYRIVGRPDQR